MKHTLPPRPYQVRAASFLYLQAYGDNNPVATYIMQIYQGCILMHPKNQGKELEFNGQK